MTPQDYLSVLKEMGFREPNVEKDDFPDFK